jgi:hypothetical protein
MTIARILVVDDEPDVEALVTQRFRRRVRNGELSYESLFEQFRTPTGGGGRHRQVDDLRQCREVHTRPQSTLMASFPLNQDPTRSFSADPLRLRN